MKRWLTSKSLQKNRNTVENSWPGNMLTINDSACEMCSMSICLCTATAAGKKSYYYLLRARDT